MECILSKIAPTMWIRAVDVFGTEEKAAGWMRTRLRQLAGRTPEETLLEDPKSEEVAKLLDQIDYVVYS